MISIFSARSETPSPLGLENGSINDSQITGSKHTYDLKPSKARLNGEKCWSAINKNPMWIQIDFLTVLIVSGIQTQGAGINTQWVKTLEIKTGLKVSSLSSIMENNITKVVSMNE